MNSTATYAAPAGEGGPSPHIPQPGESFIPWGRFTGSLVPDQLVRIVGRGAAMLYGQLTTFAGPEGRCFPSQQTLAAKLGLSAQNGDRQIRRYLDRLETCTACGCIANAKRNPCKCARPACFIRVHQRGLNESNVYEFLWHEELANVLKIKDWTSSAESKSLILKDRTKMSGQDRTKMSAYQSIEQENRLIQNPAASPVPRSTPPPRHKHPLPKNWGWPTSDIEQICKVIGKFRYQNGNNVSANEPTIEALIRIGNLYLTAPYSIAAVLAKVQTRIEKKRSHWPRDPLKIDKWIAAVVESELSASWLQRHPPARAENVTGSPEILIRQLANMKGFPKK